MYDYSNLREVLKQALECKNGNVFARVLIGYIKDENFWQYAPLDDLELVNSLAEMLLSYMKKAVQE